MNSEDREGGTVRVTVPGCGSWVEVLAWTASVQELPEASAYVFDFKDIGFVTPGWMVVVGDALNRFRLDRPRAKRRAEGYKRPELSYASAAGFFRYFGVGWGREPGELDPNDAFIPLTIEDVDALRDRAASAMLHHGDLIQDEAERMVGLITRLTEGDVFDTLSYALREIVRNVVEHSGSERYTVAAQWWPAAGRAELVVSDAGMGLARSLRRDPKLDVPDDGAALTLATSPGVTSRRRSGRAGDVWRNTGYGLYMTAGICREAGSFTLMSGSQAMITDVTGSRVVSCAHEGTTVVLAIETPRLGDLASTLSRLRDEAGRSRESPSVASMSKRVERRDVGRG